MPPPLPPLIARSMQLYPFSFGASILFPGFVPFCSAILSQNYYLLQESAKEEKEEGKKVWRKKSGKRTKSGSRRLNDYSLVSRFVPFCVTSHNGDNGDRDAGGLVISLHLPAYHIIRSLAGVSEGHVLRHYAVQHHLHVVPDVRVPVLVDRQGGGGVEELYVHQTDAKLCQLR